MSSSSRSFSSSYICVFTNIVVSFSEGNVRIPDGPHGGVNPLQDNEFKKTGKLSLLKGQSSYSPLGGGGIIRDDDDMEGGNL